MADPPRLQTLTPARVDLGRAGQALPTRPMLDFQLACARARDAIQTELQSEGLREALSDRPVIEVHSRAPDRATYLRRPDLGRRLAASDAAKLAAGGEVVFVVADGLSAAAIHGHAASLLQALFDRLGDWTIAPIILAQHGRVALGDDIGAAMDADIVVMLIGERPGLSAPDSLGVYLTWAPRPGRRDSERNCISNIRPPHGLGYAEAADRIVRLMQEARKRRLTGIALKDDAPQTALLSDGDQS
jgi:ethanolamine ammonia-lyase small subunit